MRVAVYPDFSQFYLRRFGAPWASDGTTSLGYEQKLWTNGEFVTVGTHRKHGSMPLEVHVVDGPPDLASEWQHVVEVSLRTGPPHLEVFNWGEDEAVATVEVPDASIRLRVHWRGLDENLFEGIDNEGNSGEEIAIAIWAQAEGALAVLRCWSHWDLPPISDLSEDGRRQVEGVEAVMERTRTLEQQGHKVLQQPLPGGTRGSTYAVYLDRSDGSWWADGDAIRRTLREISADEATALLRLMEKTPPRGS